MDHFYLAVDNTPQAEVEDGQVITWAQPKRRNGEGFLEVTDGESDRLQRQILTGLAKFDLPDVFRTLNRYKVQEFSWFWGPYTSKIGRRFDHIFASAALNATSCRYIHPLRETGLSDHSAIEAVFQPA